jgi:chromosomal replication initiation ATPase DnaA
LAARLAAGHYEVPLREIAARTRRSRLAARARHVAIYIAHVTLGIPLRAVATEFGRDRSTVAYACHVVEDARDDPGFDVALADLELTAGVLIGLDRRGASK